MLRLSGSSGSASYAWQASQFNSGYPELVEGRIARPALNKSGKNDN